MLLFELAMVEDWIGVLFGCKGGIDGIPPTPTTSRLVGSVSRRSSLRANRFLFIYFLFLLRLSILHLNGRLLMLSQQDNTVCLSDTEIFPNGKMGERERKK